MAFTKVTDTTSVRTMYTYIGDDDAENLMYSTSITADLVYVDHAAYELVYQKTEGGQIYDYRHMDGEGWTKEQRTDRTWEYLVNSAISSGGYGTYIVGIGSYDNASYNTQKGYYEYNADCDGSTLLYRAYFKHGALAKLEVFNENVKQYVFIFDYTAPTIEIPQI